MELTKKIFGKNFRISCNPYYASVVSSGLNLYPDTDGKKIDVTISIENISTNTKVLAQNPATFQKFESSICYQFYRGIIYWEIEKNTGKIIVQLYISPQKPGLRNSIRKLRSMEFATEVEEFQQILHELILVPSAYFFEDLAVVHSAAFTINGKAVLLAGTGGTGKTSALLSLRKNKEVAFVTDDIAIISSDGYVHPNLAWPKIYGYNLSSYITKAELLKGRGVVDKIQFNFKVRINPKRVRRKLKPNILYQEYESSKVPIQDVFYLFRDNCREMFASPLNKTDAVQMGLHIMKTEYNKLFHDYLDWDQYNSIALNIRPILDLEKVFEKWTDNLGNAFKGVNVHLLHIPFHIPHLDYLENIHQFILKN